jgi:hypothetical protein
MISINIKQATEQNQSFRDYYLKAKFTALLLESTDGDYITQALILKDMNPEGWA